MFMLRRCNFRTISHVFAKRTFKNFQYCKTMAFPYPECRRDETVKDVYHGVEVTDPYRWLEDPDSEETKQFVEAQNSLTQPYINECPHKKIINETLTNLWNYPKRSHPARHGDNYYQFRNTGLQNQNVIYKLNHYSDEGVVFLDPNLLSDDGTVALAQTRFSENGATFAYGLSTSGSDWQEIKFIDVKTGKDYDEVLQKVRFSNMVWTHDHLGIFYGAYLEQQGKADGSETVSSEGQKLYYHKVGTNQSEDVVAAEFDDRLLRISAQVSDCGKYLVLTPMKGCKNNLVYYAPLPEDKNYEHLKIYPVVTELEADFEYVANNGSKFIFYTNKNAPNYCLVEIDFDNPEESNWKILVPEHSKDVLNWTKTINDNFMVLCYLQNVTNVLYLHNLTTGERVYTFPLEIGTVGDISGKRHHKELFFSFYSFLTPSCIYRIDFTKQQIELELIHETVIGRFDPNLYESKQVFYPSKDGTQIPMFIIRKKPSDDSPKPCLLYGYGGFNISLTPSFSISRLVFMSGFEGVYAVANIRGGGEYGDNWHNGGRFANKQNSFDDFQQAAKYLVANKYTTEDKLIIQGGSNGGLLVGACITQAPQLFGAAICQVGVLDMLRYHKFTIAYAWKSDYGCSDDPEEFKYLYKYSPLHNVRVPPGDVQYPATLLLTADHDDRVVPLHSFKFIAELQHTVGKNPKQKKPLMIRVETRAGHGAGKPTSKVIDEITDMFCFISRALNLPFRN